MERYYRILNLSPNASKDEVKKQYRKLVKKYHPDRNPSPIASQKFIQITEAYEAITSGKAVRKKVYKSSPRPKSKEEMRQERVKKARKRYREKQFKEQLENEKYFQSLMKSNLWRVIKVNAVIGALFAIVLFAEYVLPVHVVEDEITDAGYVSTMPGGGAFGIVQTKSRELYEIENYNYAIYAAGNDYYRLESRVFKSPIEFVAIDDDRVNRYPIRFTLYRSAWILALAFLIPLITLFRPRRTVLFTIAYYTSAYGVSLLAFVFFFYVLFNQ